MQDNLISKNLSSITGEATLNPIVGEVSFEGAAKRNFSHNPILSNNIKETRTLDSPEVKKMREQKQLLSKLITGTFTCLLLNSI